jgi:hypothetical protein
MTPESLRTDALAMLARLKEDARRLGAPHALAYFETHEAAFIAAYTATHGKQGPLDPISPFLYTLT